MTGFLNLSDDEMQLFISETTEHIDILEEDLLALERGGVNPELVARIFRSAHTVKGAAGTVGLNDMARLTHAMETLFDRMRAGELVPAPPAVISLLAAVDELRRMLAEVAAGSVPAPAAPGLLITLDAVAEEAGDGPALSAAAEATGWPVGADIAVRLRLSPDCAMPAVRALQVLLALETVGRVVSSDPSQEAIETERVTDQMTVWLDTGRDAADIRAALAGVPDLAEMTLHPAAGAEEQPPAVSERSGGVRSMGGRPGEDRTIRVDVALLDDLMNLVGELVIDRGRLAGIGQSLVHLGAAHDVAAELGRLTGHLARVTGTLQEAVLKARMLPVDRVFRKFPRMVRDMAEHLGKQVDFQVAGADTELDRSLLEIISDPLMHLLRNALDHGLEPPEERLPAGKPAAGTLRLAAAHEENHVVILLQDDGRGVDPERIRAAAVRKGLLSPERARELSEQDAIQLLFAPGFSTADRVTDLSGRGVGLDVVRRNIEGAGGRVELESRPGAGTAFRILLPLTLATLRALLVQAAGDTLALPLSTVAETLRVEPEGVLSIKGRWVTRVRGRVVPLLWLEQFMSPAFRPGRSSRPLLLVLVSHKGELVGLVVDALVGEQEVVVKGLGEFFGQVRGVRGVTILGDGSVALILDVGGVIGVLSADRNGAPAAGGGWEVTA